jgi:TBC1 domain family member 13
MLSQEFALENVIRLWDTLLADHDRFLFVNFVCVAMVMLKRDTLLKSEFSECIEYLQLQQ